MWVAKFEIAPDCLNNSGTISSDNCTSYDYIYYTITEYGTIEDAITYTSKGIELESGNYKIIFTYKKDDSDQNRTDRGYFKNSSILEGVKYT